MTPGVTMTPPYWVVIPAYNEAATVRDVAMRARQQCEHVVVVDDGSSDGTGQTLAGVDVTLLRNLRISVKPAVSRTDSSMP